MSDSEITLPEHEVRSEKRAEHLGAKIDKLKGHDKMSAPVNVFTPAVGDGGGSALPLAMMAGMGGGGGGLGAGLGAGLVGGLLGGLLFGGRGIGDACGKARDCQSPEMAATAAMGLAGGIAAVSDKVSEGDMMLMNAISAGFATQTTNTLQQTLMLMQQANQNQALTIAELCTINQNVSAQGCATRETVMADGNTTRLLITQINTDNLNRKLTIADLDRRDECNRGRSREVEVNVAQTVNQVQAQAQQQQQQQQITGLLTHLCGVVCNLQSAVATNSNLIVGNTGATTTGAQTANPVNVKG